MPSLESRSINDQRPFVAAKKSIGSFTQDHKEDQEHRLLSQIKVEERGQVNNEQSMLLDIADEDLGG